MRRKEREMADGRRDLDEDFFLGKLVSPTLAELNKAADALEVLQRQSFSVHGLRPDGWVEREHVTFFEDGTSPRWILAYAR